jgi:hypothetical protein
MNLWQYNNTPINEIPEDAIGFVYLITNCITGRQYIGKKNFYSTRSSLKTVTLKSGVKKKKKVRKTNESDWRIYHGSSDELSKDVEFSGSDNFKREILRLCYSKAEMGYYEAKYQFDFDVLLKPELFYNGWISCKIHRTHMLKR